MAFDMSLKTPIEVRSLWSPAHYVSERAIEL